MRPGSAEGRNRVALQGPLRNRVGLELRLILLEREERPVGFALLPRWAVPRTGLRAGQLRAARQRRSTQDRVAEPKVDTAADPNSGRQQRRVPGRGVVPDPAHRRALERTNARGEIPVGDQLDGAGIRRE